MSQLENFGELVVQLPGPRISTLVRGSGLLLAAQLAACSGEITTQDYDRSSGAVAAAGSAVIPGGAGRGGTGGTGGRAGTGSAGTGGRVGGTAGSASGTGGSAGGSANGGRCNAVAIIVTGDRCGGSGNSGCHGTNSPQGDFAASEAALRGYVDEVSLNGAGCGLIIDSGTPADSVLLQMVQGTQDKAECYQLNMPLGDEALSQADQDCIADWLTQF
jgi:hypothetical protein